MIRNERRVFLVLILSFFFSTFGECNSKREIKEEERILLEILQDTGENLIIQEDAILKLEEDCY